MTTPQPLTKASELLPDVNAFVQSVAVVGQYDRKLFESLEKRSIELQGPGGDVVRGSLNRGRIYSAVGRLEDAQRMFRNAELNHGVIPARVARMSHFVNHGFASEVLALADVALTDRGEFNFVDLAEIVVAAGAFHKIVEKVNASLLNNEVLIMTGVLDLARRACEVLDQLGVSDAQMAAMLDVAGEQLRKNKLWWQGDTPDVTVLPAGAGGPALIYDYRVHVTPDEAAAISWDLTDALVSHELDLGGVFIGFIGTNVPVRLAA